MEDGEDFQPGYAEAREDGSDSGGSDAGGGGQRGNRSEGGGGSRRSRGGQGRTRDNPGHHEYDVPDRPRAERGGRRGYTEHEPLPPGPWWGQPTQPQFYPWMIPPYGLQPGGDPPWIRTPERGTAERDGGRRSGGGIDHRPGWHYSDNPGWYFVGDPKHPDAQGAQGGQQGKESKAMDGGEKVSVNLGAGGFGPLGGYAGGGGGHSDGGTNAALMALLMGGRDRGCDHGDGFGLGGGLGALLVLSALGGGGFGGFGRGFGHGDHVNVDCGGRRGGPDCDAMLSISQQLGAIQGAIPAAGLEIQNGILAQTNALQGALATQALATQVGFANTGDKVTNTGAALLAAINNDGSLTRSAIAHLSDKISASELANLQRELGVAQATLAEERFNRRSRDVEVNVTQTVNQQQAQAQAQVQLQQQGLLLQRLLCELAENTQYSKATAANTNFIVGNQGVTATGPQTATPTSTNVNAK